MDSCCRKCDPEPLGLRGWGSRMLVYWVVCRTGKMGKENSLFLKEAPKHACSEQGPSALQNRIVVDQNQAGMLELY